MLMLLLLAALIRVPSQNPKRLVGIKMIVLGAGSGNVVRASPGQKLPLSRPIPRGGAAIAAGLPTPQFDERTNACRGPAPDAARRAAR